MVEVPLTSTSELDEAGRLSIVLQGGLSPSNLIETALHCQHWRDVFPFSEIILSISASDLFSNAIQPGLLGRPTLAMPFCDNGQFNLAMECIHASCDKIVLSKGALPLPPIKTYSHSANNVNLQIAAAKAGLAEATNQYVLRVRSDLVFSNRSFIEQYISASKLPRGNSAVFAQRILISPLYTLNPFTIERMPLHYSDWFHFGYADDVRKLWDIPEMTFADAVYYKTRKCRVGSLATERVMVPRLAVEQHLVYNCFRSDFPNLVLDYHNDLTSIDLSLDILVDNFMICDLVESGCIFDKYSFDFDKPDKSIHCIMPDDWEAMAWLVGPQRREVLESKHTIATAPKLVPFPRVYPAGSLSTIVGNRNHGEILAWSVDGVLTHGPYDTLPKGSYLATMHISSLEGEGTVSLQVALEEGQHVLADREFFIGREPISQIELPFEILADQGDRFEVVATINGIKAIAVSGLTISNYAPEVQPFPRVFQAGSLSTIVGKKRHGEICSSFVDGVLTHGPYDTLPKGNYLATVHISQLEGQGKIALQATLDEGRELLAEQKFFIGTEPISQIALAFEILKDRGDRFEVVAIVSGIRSISVSSLTVTKQP